MDRPRNRPAYPLPVRGLRQAQIVLPQNGPFVAAVEDAGVQRRFQVTHQPLRRRARRGLPVYLLVPAVLTLSGHAPAGSSGGSIACCRFLLTV